jgi:hypothetical protein
MRARATRCGGQASHCTDAHRPRWAYRYTPLAISGGQGLALCPGVRCVAHSTPRRTS